MKTRTKHRELRFYTNLVRRTLPAILIVLALTRSLPHTVYSPF